MRFFGVKKATGLSSWGGTKRDGSVGYIWLSENIDCLTGQRQAFILDIYVEEKERRKALRQRFLELAEKWGVLVYRPIGGRS